MTGATYRPTCTSCGLAEPTGHMAWCTAGRRPGVWARLSRRIRISAIGGRRG